MILMLGHSRPNNVYFVQNHILVSKMFLYQCIEGQQNQEVEEGVDTGTGTCSVARELY